MPSCTNPANSFTQVRALAFAATLLLLGSAAAYSQPKPSSTPAPMPEPASAGPFKDPSSPDFGSPESEMRAKLILKAEKKQYDENVARAREASELATQLVDSFAAKQAFGHDDAKKLERLEKLTKRIRNEAGGSDTDPEANEIPGMMESAIKRVAELADEMRKLVEGTPRHVISASVIDQANKLLGLIQHVRNGASQ
jgi:hypothetical protein